MIEVVDFHKSYGNVAAVCGLTFSVRPGQIVGLVGRNGAGKTTTLRALSGVIPPSKGRLAINGFDLHQSPVEAKRSFAYVPDTPPLFDLLTVWEHLEFVAAAYQVDAFQPRAEQLLEQFELAGRRDTIAQELSRGMRQKVGICCGYLHEPPVMLFDEPLTGLDPQAIRILKNSIIDHAQRGVAIMISSHLLSLVEDLCTDLLILGEGRERFCGPLSQLRQECSGLGAKASLEDVFFHLTDEPQTVESSA
jgi:ABC-2 type transport system ATP-binding protein